MKVVWYPTENAVVNLYSTLPTQIYTLHRIHTLSKLLQSCCKSIVRTIVVANWFKVVWQCDTCGSKELLRTHMVAQRKNWTHMTGSHPCDSHPTTVHVLTCRYTHFCAHGQQSNNEYLNESTRTYDSTNLIISYKSSRTDRLEHTNSLAFVAHSYVS